MLRFSRGWELQNRAGDVRRRDPSRWARAGTHADLAGWLLGQELDAEAEMLGLCAAADLICQKLFHRLSRLVSPIGSRAMLSRALHLSRAEFPFLLAVRAGPEGSLDGLDACIRAVEPQEAAAGVQSVVGNLLALLVDFIGEDLTLRVVEEVWPSLATLEPRRRADSDGAQAAS